MKRLLPLALALTLALTACTQTAQVTPPPPVEVTVEVTVAPTPEPTPAPVLPADCPLDMNFLSGAGGWATYMLLNRDGSFEGDFHDSDMGDTGPGYNGGKYYFCNFSGRFTDIKQVDERTWTMTLEDVETGIEPGWERIEETDYENEGEKVRILYISAEPYGMDGGKDFILYGPDTPLEGLDEEFLSWWPGRWENEGLTTLCCYGLYNEAMGYGFFSGMEYPEGFISNYDEFEARQAALDYYENTVFTVERTPRIDVPAGWEGEIAFTVVCTKDGEAQPDRTITLSRQNGEWVVVREGY